MRYASLIVSAALLAKAAGSKRAAWCDFDGAFDLVSNLVDTLKRKTSG